MTRIMICGTKTRGDIDLLAAAGVNAIGLICEVWQEIPCNLNRHEARELARLATPSISSVLIVTEEDVDEVCRMAEYVAPDILQLHGFNPPEEVATIRERTGVKVVKTLHVRGQHLAEPASSIEPLVATGVSGILLDSYRDGQVGATGEAMSLTLARQIRDRIYPVPLILAGGLNCHNVAQAIDRVRPHAVDTFSGVTTNGTLDGEKVKSFVASVRAGKKGSTIGRA